jgi:hypothetical protein
LILGSRLISTRKIMRQCETLIFSTKNAIMRLINHCSYHLRFRFHAFTWGIGLFDFSNLSAGTYTAGICAVDAKGNQSNEKTAIFTVVP